MRRESNFYLAMGFALVALGLYSCASIGTPSGGARDEEPPVFVKSVPAPFATNVSADKIEIYFDELVSLKDALTNVTVSPSGKSAPKVTNSGKKVIVSFEDSLQPDATYTIDFGNSIVDLNEANVLKKFTFSFSTGETLDSLQIAGILLDAYTLEPQQGILVGAHSQLADSVFKKIPLERITKTDDRGRFVLRNLKPIPYRIFALGDLNNDKCWDNPAEDIAFYPRAVVPYCEPAVANDSIFNPLTGALDSVVVRGRTRFLPNDLLLSMFNIGYKPQYLVTYERPDSTYLRLIFNDKQAAPPVVNFLDETADSRSLYELERSINNDTLTYRLYPQLVRKDTIRMSVAYMRTGKDSQLEEVIDSLLFTAPRVRKMKQSKKTPKQLRDDSIAAENAKFISAVNITGSNLDIYAPAIFEFSEPASQPAASAWRVEEKQDTLWVPFADVECLRDSLIPRRYHLAGRWNFDTQYRLVVDSLAVQGISGRSCRTFIYPFKTKKQDDYASLRLRLVPDTIQGFVEVLNSGDEPVSRAVVTNGEVFFPYLTQSDYYARFIADANGNGIFDAGDYDSGVQPEDVYYYPKQLSLKRYDRNEVWDLNATAVDLQKPDAIKKNKPEKTKSVSKKKKKGSLNSSTTTSDDEEEDDYFDVNRNPFDPNQKSRTSTVGSY